MDPSYLLFQAALGIVEPWKVEGIEFSKEAGTLRISLGFERGARFPGSLTDFVEDYRPYYDFLREKGRLESWSRSQGYLAVANMMTGSAALGIQSCAIEGFDEDLVLAILGLDRKDWTVSMVILFGYPAEPTRPKIRASLESLVVRH
jgi:nitroreductase